ncbi:MAG: hypothetical protein Q4B26_14775 [Eubacteriales bacterium]|nr:hypothetical protein [Eubacteriales bacterium]
MIVKISSDYGENRFDMDAASVKSIILMAMRLADKDETEEPQEPVTVVGLEDTADSVDLVENEGKEPETGEYESYEKPEKHTRNGSLFGSGWRDNISAQEDQRTFARNMEGYKGFLYLKCPNCDKVKGFNARIEIKSHRCSCGHEFELKDLKPMYTHCDCGKDFKYFTNMDEDKFSYDCLNCGSRVRMKINTRRTAYVTDGSTSGGARNSSFPYSFQSNRRKSYSYY